MILTKLAVKVAAACSRWQGRLGATIQGDRRSTSECKTQLKQLQTRLTYLKVWRVEMVMRERLKLARFVENGDVDFAFISAEQIVEDENMIRLYQLLYELCHVVLTNLPHIRPSVKEAVCKLGFAASRCGDVLPELRTIRGIFVERYGSGEFEDEGLHVNLEVKERLGLTRGTVAYDVKRRKVRETIVALKLEEEKKGAEQ